MQTLALDVIQNHLLDFLYLDESARFACTFKPIMKLHKQKMKTYRDISLPLIDYHCVKATLKDMRNRPNEFKSHCCWDTRIRKGHYCGCERNRYIPLIKNETKPINSEIHFKCNCQLKTITVCNPSTYLFSISRFLPDEYQFLRILEIITYRMFHPPYKNGGSANYFYHMNNWLQSKKLDLKIFSNIPKYKKKSLKRNFYGEIKKTYY